MSRRLLSHSFVGLSMGFLGGIVGCTAPDLSQPCPIPPGATEAERQAAEKVDRIDRRPQWTGRGGGSDDVGHAHISCAMAAACRRQTSTIRS